MKNINIYLNFNGNTEEAFNFYKSVFGGDFAMIQRFSQVPGIENLSPSDKEKIMHISLPIWNFILMWTDAVESLWQKVNMWDNFSISLHPESKEEADKIFWLLSDWWKVQVELQDMYWWAYFGMLTDRFWVQWMFNYAYQS